MEPAKIMTKAILFFFCFLLLPIIVWWCLEKSKYRFFLYTLFLCTHTETHRTDQALLINIYLFIFFYLHNVFFSCYRFLFFCLLFAFLRVTKRKIKFLCILFHILLVFGVFFLLDWWGSSEREASFVINAWISFSFLASYLLASMRTQNEFSSVLFA